LCPLFQMGNLHQINVSQITKEFKNGNKNSLSLLKTFFFLSLWYNETFGAENISN